MDLKVVPYLLLQGDGRQSLLRMFGFIEALDE